MIPSLRRVSRRAARGLALSIKTPADGWLIARMLAWRAVLPALKRLLPLPRLVDLLDASPDGGERRPDREQRIASLAERVFGSTSADDNCLELSLVTYRYLAAAGADPQLVIAMREADQPRGHAWVTVDGVPVHDSAARLAGFVSLAIFESGSHGHPSGVMRDAEG